MNIRKVDPKIMNGALQIRNAKARDWWPNSQSKTKKRPYNKSTGNQAALAGAEKATDH